MKKILHFNAINSFSTERLFAKKLEPSDLEKFLVMHANKQVMKTLGGIRNEVQTIENLNWNLKQWEDNDFGLWIFYLKDTGEWVGRGGLRRVEIGGNSEIELGYALMPKFWSQGIATEITQSCLKIAFEVIRLEDIVSFTLTTNKVSQRVMEKCGFKYERDIVHADLPHVLYRIKNYRKVQLVPYDKKWPVLFEEGAQNITEILGDHLKKIYHMGSTAIPKMPAKPVIDIMLECDNLDDIDLIKKQLNTLDYFNIRRHVIPHRSFFTRRQDTHISYHLHIRERGDPQVRRHINFRDYLVNHSEDAKAYASLKFKLAEQFADNMNNYVSGKDNLVQQIDRKAKFWLGQNQDFLPQNSGKKVNVWSQEKIIKAMEANLNVYLTHFAQYINQISLIRIPGYTVINSSLLDDTFNSILEADFSRNDADKKIQEAIQYFTANKIPFAWWVSPYDKPEDLAEQLQQSRLIHAENKIGMYIMLDNWQTSDNLSKLEIIKVKNKKGLRDFSNVHVKNQSASDEYYEWVAEIYTTDDPIEFYVGYINSQPVARGLITYFAQVAGIYSVATSMEENGTNYNTLMEQFLLKQAKEQGFHMAVLQATEKNLPLYNKLGFRECCVFKVFKQME